jgi:hypothetical protein
MDYSKFFTPNLGDIILEVPDEVRRYNDVLFGTTIPAQEIRIEETAVAIDTLHYAATQPLEEVFPTKQGG